MGYIKPGRKNTPTWRQSVIAISATRWEPPA